MARHKWKVLPNGRRGPPKDSGWVRGQRKGRLEAERPLWDSVQVCERCGVIVQVYGRRRFVVPPETREAIYDRGRKLGTCDEELVDAVHDR